MACGAGTTLLAAARRARSHAGRDDLGAEALAVLLDGPLGESGQKLRCLLAARAGQRHGGGSRVGGGSARGRRGEGQGEGEEGTGGRHGLADARGRLGRRGRSGAEEGEGQGQEGLRERGTPHRGGAVLRLQEWGDAH